MSAARILTFCLPFFVAAFTAAPARCSLIAQYSSSSQWQANATVSNDITFGSLLPSGNNSCYIGGTSTPQCSSSAGAGTLMIEGVQFLGSPSSDVEVYSPNLASWYNFNTGDPTPVGFLAITPTSAPQIQISVAGLGVTAFGLDLMSTGGTGPYNVNVDGTSYTSVSTQSAPNVVFFGGTFTTPISTITLTMPTLSYETMLIDDFQFGTAGSQQQQGETGDAPEAATMVMIGSGLIGLNWLRRRVS